MAVGGVGEGRQRRWWQMQADEGLQSVYSSTHTARLRPEEMKTEQKETKQK